MKLKDKESPSTLMYFLLFFSLIIRINNFFPVNFERMSERYGHLHQISVPLIHIFYPTIP